MGHHAGIFRSCCWPRRFDFFPKIGCNSRRKFDVPTRGWGMVAAGVGGRFFVYGGLIQCPGDSKSDIVETASGIDPHTIREARV